MTAKQILSHNRHFKDCCKTLIRSQVKHHYCMQLYSAWGTETLLYISLGRFKIWT